MRDEHLSVRIDAAQKAALETIAAQQDTTVGALVRRAVLSLLRGTTPGGTPAPHRRRRTRPVVRESEMAWLADNRAALRQFRGQYLVIEGDSLVAHGPDLKVVLEAARKQGIKVPFVERVSDRDDPPDVWMGL